MPVGIPPSHGGPSGAGLLVRKVTMLQPYARLFGDRAPGDRLCRLSPVPLPAGSLLRETWTPHSRRAWELVPGPFIRIYLRKY